MRVPCLSCFLALLLASALSAQTIVNQWSIPAPGRPGVFGVAFDPITETFWTTDSSNDIVQQFDRQGTLLHTYSFPGTTIVGCAVDPLTGNVWLGDEAETMSEMTPLGALTGRSFSVQPHITDLSGLAFDPRRNHLYGSQDSGTPRRIGEFDLSGTHIATIDLTPSGSQDADGLEYNQISDTFYLGEETGAQVIEVDR